MFKRLKRNKKNKMEPQIFIVKKNKRKKRKRINNKIQIIIINKIKT